MTADDTRTAILDAAEALLAEVGYAAMSLRAVTQRAKANLASVNYHFGSKEALARAALQRRAQPVDEERLQRLDAVESAHRSRAPLPLREVVRAFVAPVIEMSAEHGQKPCSMFCRLIAEQPPFLRDVLAEKLASVGRRFQEALRRSQPGLTVVDAIWQLHFMVGALTHTMQHVSMWQHIAGASFPVASTDEIVDRLCAFCAGGVGAHEPRPASTRKKSSKATSR